MSMILNKVFSNDFLRATVTSPTVIEPKEETSIKFHWLALQNCSLVSINFEIENAPVEIVLSDELLDLFPIKLDAGKTFEWEFPIQSVKGQEGFGIIHSETVLKPMSSEYLGLNTNTWLSIFESLSAERDGLSNDLRAKLIEVVNYRPRNGHIFLANYELFFNDFLNIKIPEIVARFLSEEFGLPEEGLPVDNEIRYEVIIGNFSFYGIEELELLAEEDCNESDDRFDAEGVREVIRTEV